MSAIMMDNWSLQSATTYLTQENPILDSRREYLTHRQNDLMRSWIDFLTIIILWDELWYYRAPSSYVWLEELVINKEQHSVISELEGIIYPVNDSTINVSYLEEILRKESDYHGFENYADYISPARVLMYQLISNALGVNLVLHNQRTKPFEDSFNRLDIFKRLDKELLEYYSFVNQSLGRELLRFEYPVLYDFIKHEASNNYDELAIALFLRQDKDIVNFKKEIDEIEYRINNGNTQLILTQLKLVSDCSNEIKNKYCKVTNLGEFRLSFTPSLTSLFVPSIVKSIPINLSTNRNLKIHTTFIKKLVDFGINKRS